MKPARNAALERLERATDALLAVTSQPISIRVRSRPAFAGVGKNSTAKEEQEGGAASRRRKEGSGA